MVIPIVLIVGGAAATWLLSDRISDTMGDFDNVIKTMINLTIIGGAFWLAIVLIKR